MDCGGFLVKGSRPPSVLSSHRPSSSQSKHHGYHTVALTSYADESLFRSVHQSRVNQPFNSFKAPWEYPKPLTPGNTYSSVRHYKAVLAASKEKPKDPPLLWCPTPGTSKHVRSSKDTNSGTDGHHWNTRTNFRHLKHTPTFVDESLFGKQLEEPTFDAPWNNSCKKEGSVQYSRPYLWDPSGDSKIQAHNGVEIDLRKRPSSASRRPKTAIGISRNDKSFQHEKPVWKP